MIILKVILKLILLPLLLPIILLQWVLTFLTACSEIFFYLLAGIFFAATLLGTVFGLFSLTEGLKMLILSFVLWMLPTVSDWLICRIIDLRITMTDTIKS